MINIKHVPVCACARHMATSYILYRGLYFNTTFLLNTPESHFARRIITCHATSLRSMNHFLRPVHLASLDESEFPRSLRSVNQNLHTRFARWIRRISPPAPPAPLGPGARQKSSPPLETSQCNLIFVDVPGNVLMCPAFSCSMSLYTDNHT